MRYTLRHDDRAQLESDLWDKMETLHSLMVTCRKLARTIAKQDKDFPITTTLYDTESMLRLTFDNTCELLEHVKLGDFDIIWENKEGYDND